MKNIYQTLEFDQIKNILQEYCSCSLGKAQVDSLSHFDTLEIIQRELIETSEALSLVYGYGSLPLGGLRDIRLFVKKAVVDGILYPAELLDVAASILCCKNVKNYERNCKVETIYVKEYIDSLIVLEDIKNEIERCIDDSGDVADNASPKLYSIRKELKGMESGIRNKLERILVAEKDRIAESLVTVRNDRYVIPIKAMYKNTFKGIVHAESSSGQTCYIEPEAVINLNNELASLKSKEIKEVERILFELSQRIKYEEDTILANQETLAHLDFIFAKGSYAKALDMNVATVTDDMSTLVLKKARHPLIDQSNVVANDIVLNSPHRVLLVTGSNTGGKTITLKTVGLLTLMTLAGLAIPVSEAVIPLFDEIFVDLGDEQSIEQSLSTFSSHMKRLVYITENVTKNSLVLLDEVGSGTDPKEGESLAISILNYLYGYNAMIVATTHYSKLKSFAKQQDYILPACVEFDMETLTPTYHLILGMVGKSNALEISSRLGLNDHIVANAKELKDHELEDQDILIEKLEKELDEVKREHEQLVSLIARNKELEDNLVLKELELEKQRVKVLNEAKQQANQIIEDSKEIVDEVIEELKAKQSLKQHEILEAVHILDESKHEEVVVKRKDDHQYIVGDVVNVLKVNRTAEITNINKDIYTISMGGINMKVKRDEIEFMHKKKKEVQKTSYAIKKSKTSTYEVNLVGQRYEEAMANLAKFLDDALVYSYPSVRIIHGFGTGALKKGVQEALKKHPHIKDYRPGESHEGGLGATIANFK